MILNLVHLMVSFNISYTYLIELEFHDFTDNSQEGMKHQMRGATQAQHGMILWIFLMYQIFLSLICDVICYTMVSTSSQQIFCLNSIQNMPKIFSLLL
jgi:hypothetical protein